MGNVAFQLPCSAKLARGSRERISLPPTVSAQVCHSTPSPPAALLFALPSRQSFRELLTEHPGANSNQPDSFLVFFFRLPWPPGDRQQASPTKWPKWAGNLDGEVLGAVATHLPFPLLSTNTAVCLGPARGPNEAHFQLVQQPCPIGSIAQQLLH